MQEAQAGPFTPDTGNAAQVLAASGAGERLFETPAERAHRLAVQVRSAVFSGLRKLRCRRGNPLLVSVCTRCGRMVSSTVPEVRQQYLHNCVQVMANFCSPVSMQPEWACCTILNL